MKKNILLYVAVILGIVLSPEASSAQIKANPDYDLILAADAGSMKHVRVAVLEGANINARTEDGITPLMYAAQNGYLDIVEFLVDLGADVNAIPYISNRTALMSAVENGYVATAEFLIRQGAGFTIRDYRNRHLMHKGALCGFWEMCDMLLYYDLPVDPVDIDKRTPLMLAAFDGYDSTVNILIENHTLVNHTDTNGNTALHMAAQNGHADVIDTLLSGGANPGIKNKNGYTALDIATMYGELECSKLLLENGATINDSITPSFNQLTLAKKSGNRKLVRMLKKQGAQPNYRPYINSVGIGLSMLINPQNSFITTILSLHEDKYNFNFELFIGARTRHKQVPLPITSSEIYMLNESRIIAGAGITKDFDLFKPISGWKYGINLGVQQIFTSADYTGYRPNPADEFTTAYKTGLFAKYDFFKITAGYEYLDLPIREYNPNHFMINMHFFLRFRKDIYENILI
ncbi:MAG: ankyrin repeat domain-containing protein [Candidatus Delongbacteria bacterium]|jgi:ankyrin repeat protein|nr:ankyrin repeat domain-containing protein [Candidatus Delongbacteria bacterium]